MGGPWSGGRLGGQQHWLAGVSGGYVTVLLVRLEGAQCKHVVVEGLVGLLRPLHEVRGGISGGGRLVVHWLAGHLRRRAHLGRRGADILGRRHEERIEIAGGGGGREDGRVGLGV